jgi:hypothetical protein
MTRSNDHLHLLTDATGPAMPPGEATPRPIHREQFLHCVGPSAWLLTVETFENPDGTLTRRRRFAPYPGL